MDMQTDSDCLRCCLTFVTGLPYESIPDFVRDHEDWSPVMVAWLEVQGYLTIRLHAAYGGELIPGDGMGQWIATGPTVRDGNHAVIFHGGTLLHDPHPSRAGLTEITAGTILVPSVKEKTG